VPQVSIIVPCLNEQDTIQQLLESIYHQTHPQNEMEVIIADGMSTDQTRQEIAAFQAGHPRLAVRIVDNPRKVIPAALNMALSAAQGEYIVRLDGHSQPAPDYIERCLAALQAGLGDNVGGRWQIWPRRATWQARSVAAAAAHPFGVGDARYRIGGAAQAVDTVPFGAYRRSLVAQLGLYDETLLSNEDYEFNARIRRHGGRVWFDPNITSVYFAPPTFQALARQYARYGYWKVRMLARYPATLRWRQAVPPLFVLCAVLLGLLSLFLPAARPVLVIQLLLYSIALLAAGLQVAIHKGDAGLMLGVPLAIGLMHFAWGSAFWWSLAQYLFSRVTK
jgi:cellulose synthase/poly-beta-1,6-N-acetylglucosamine synthase-like glycosyltransferase